MQPNKTQLPPQANTQMGGSGTYFFKGYVTAEEYAIDLQGKYGLQVYDVMRKSDATVHAALQVCKQPILGADWSIEAASTDPQDQDIAKLANYEFFNRKLDWYNTMREGLSFLEMGFFVAEKVFSTPTYQGKTYIGIDKIASRKQRSILKFEQDDGTDGITQILPSGKTGAGLTAAATVNIPREKLLYVVNDQEGENYFGVSMLRYAYKPWKIKDGLEIMNAVALENQGMGVPYIKKNMNGLTTSEPELEDARQRLRQQRVNEESFLEYPDSIEIGWTDMKGNTTKEIIPTIEYQDRQILLSVLAQFLLLGSADAAGSRAVSQDHSRLFVKALVSTAKIWQAAFQQDVLNQWVDLNFSNLQNGYPKLVFSSISDEDLVEIATAVSQLMPVGALHADAGSENRLRSLIGLPPMSDEDYKAYADTIAADKQAKILQAQQNLNQPVPAGTDPALQTPAPPGDPPSKQPQPDDDLDSPTQASITSVAEAILQARKAQAKLFSLVGM